MNIALIGSGGREDALCRKLKESRNINQIFQPSLCFWGFRQSRCTGWLNHPSCRQKKCKISSTMPETSFMPEKPCLIHFAPGPNHAVYLHKRYRELV